MHFPTFRNFQVGKAPFVGRDGYNMKNGVSISSWLLNVKICEDTEHF
jgi:hypothetical protein